MQLRIVNSLYKSWFSTICNCISRTVCQAMDSFICNGKSCDVSASRPVSNSVQEWKQRLGGG